jgi:hypothetical protein
MAIGRSREGFSRLEWTVYLDISQGFYVADLTLHSVMYCAFMVNREMLTVVPMSCT